MRIAALAWVVVMVGYALYPGGALLSLGLLLLTQVVLLAAWREHRWLRRLLLVTASCTVATLAAEVVARRIWPLAPYGIQVLPESGSSALYLPDPELGRVLAPDFKGYFVHPEYDREAFETNPDGFRGPEWGAPESEAGPRVVLLGDSMAVGYGVEYAQTISAELQRLLRERWEKAAVYNLGVPGYGPRHERVLLGRVFDRLKPDLVILAFYDGNDLQNCRAHLELNDAPTTPSEGRPRSLLSPSYWAEHSALGRRIAVQWIAWQTRRGTLRHHALATILRLTQVQVEAQVAEDTILAIEAVAGVAEDCSREGAQFLFLRVPMGSQTEVVGFDDVVRRYGLEVADHDRTLPGRVLLEACEELGAPTLDLLPLLELPGESSNPYYFTEGHLNAVGHRVIAQRVFTCLLEEGLLR